MADLKISDLSALSGGDLVAADELAIVDDSASETKKITVSNLIANGVTLISDDAIPGAKILFGAGDIATAALADSAVTAAKIGADQVTAAKIADNTIVNLVSTLPTSGDYTGQLALDTDDNSLYVYSGSAWLNTKAPGSVNAFTDTTSGIINITTAVSSGTATVTASIDNTASAAQFLAGPVGSGGTVGYRTIDGGDLPTATTSAKGGVIVNGGGLSLSTDTIQIANSVSASSVKHLVTYDANGLITGGSAIASSDLPVATSSARGAVVASDGLVVDASGNLSIDNTVTAGTYTKVTVTSKGVVSSGDTLAAADIPDHSATKLTSGTIGSSLIANDSITADKLANQSTTKFGGALGSDNVTIFPSGDFKGQFFYDETTQDLYIFTGSAFVPVTVLSGNLVNAGAYNASTNQMSSVTSAGSAAGFSAGAALPAPAVTNLNHYVVVDTSGTGSGAAPAVALAPPDMLLSQGVGTEYSLIDVSNAIAGQTASNISLIAAGDIVATDVQAGIQELDTEKLPKAGGTMTGNLNLGTSTNVVFEGSSADDYETTLTVTNPTADRTITFPNVTGTVVTSGDTGSVTSTMIVDGAIVNADINASAEIAVSKLANGTARQLLQTDAGGSGVEFTSNVDVPGTLDVTSGATFDSTVAVTGLLSANGKLAYPAGTAAAVSLYSGSDTDTGIYSPGSNQFGISTAGTSRVVVDSSGNIIIGSTSAATSSQLTIRAASPNLSLYATPGNASIINLGDTDAYNIGRIKYDNTNNSLQFDANSQQRMQIDNSGRLLLGTTTEGFATFGDNLTIADSGHCGVTIRSGTSSQGNIYFSDGSSGGSEEYEGIIQYLHDVNAMAFGVNNGSEKLRIDSSGNVGINNSSPSSYNSDGRNLVVGSGSGSQGLTIASGTSGYGNIYFADGTSGNALYSGMLSYYHADNHMQFRTASEERMRIDSSGNVFIGGTSAANADIALNANGSASFAGTLTSYPSGAAYAYQLNNGNTNLGGLYKDTSSSRLLLGDGTTTKVDIKGSDGSASFAGVVSAKSVDVTQPASGYTFIGRKADSTATFYVEDTGTVQFGGNTDYLKHTAADGLFRVTSGATKWNLAANGSASFTSTVSAQGSVLTSDQRFKENITDANPQLADVTALGNKLRNWDWAADAPVADKDTRFLGLVAQEAETICPGIVTTIARTKDGAELTPEVVVPAVYETRTVPAVLDDEGEVVEAETTEQVLVTEEQVTPATYEQLDDSYKGIKNDILIMKLLGAVAELSAKVAALEAG